MKYKLIAPWLDVETNIVHPVGEIVEMEDENRANNLIKLGAFEKYEEKKKAEAKPKASTKTSSKKKK